MTQKHLIPKIESPLLGHNQINYEVEKFIAQGLVEEEIPVRLFPKNMKLQDRLVALYDMRLTIVNKYETKGYTHDLIAKQPLVMGVNQLIQEYLHIEYQLSLLN
jgi:hypothetical protein